MKRWISMLLVFLMAVSLCGFSSEKKSNAVLTVEEQIKKLVEITLPDKEKRIADVRAAYDALTENEQKQVENYNTLAEIEFRNELVYFEEALPDLTDKANTIIELYEKIYSAANEASKYLNKSWGDVQSYYDYIMSVSNDTTLESWKKRYTGFTGYWQIAFFHVAIVVDSKNFSPQKYEDEYDFSSAIQEDLQKLSKEEIETVFAKAYKYRETLFILKSFEETDVIYERLKIVNSKYKITHEKELDALKTWAFAVTDGVSYAIHPSGSLSNVVKGWSDMEKAINRAEKEYYLI